MVKREMGQVIAAGVLGGEAVIGVVIAIIIAVGWCYDKKENKAS